MCRRVSYRFISDSLIDSLTCHDSYQLVLTCSDSYLTYSDSYRFVSHPLDSSLFIDAVPLDDSYFTASQYGLLDTVYKLSILAMYLQFDLSLSTPWLYLQFMTK